MINRTNKTTYESFNGKTLSRDNETGFYHIKVFAKTKELFEKAKPLCWNSSQIVLEAVISEILVKEFLLKWNPILLVTHPGYYKSGSDKGDILTINRFSDKEYRKLVWDVKTSTRYENVAFDPRDDIKINLLVGTTFKEFSEDQLHFVIYGTSEYDDALINSHTRYNNRTGEPFQLLYPHQFEPFIETQALKLKRRKPIKLIQEELIKS